MNESARSLTSRVSYWGTVVRRTIFILIIGLAGIAVLLSLGTWQVQRLAWKEGILAEIDAKISGAQPPFPVRQALKRTNTNLWKCQDVSLKPVSVFW